MGLCSSSSWYGDLFVSPQPGFDSTWRDENLGDKFHWIDFSSNNVLIILLIKVCSTLVECHRSNSIDDFIIERFIEKHWKIVSDEWLLWFWWINHSVKCVYNPNMIVIKIDWEKSSRQVSEGNVLGHEGHPPEQGLATWGLLWKITCSYQGILQAHLKWILCARLMQI